MLMFGLSIWFDIEVEVGFVVGMFIVFGDWVCVDDFDDYVFGVVLFNDWSVCDI